MLQALTASCWCTPPPPTPPPAALFQGIVYGDIGTSPLYVWSSIYPSGAQGVSENALLGAMSTIFWTITSIVLLKYVWLMLMADDHGEGARAREEQLPL